LTETSASTVAPTVAEFTAVFLSRQLRDEAVGILGTRSEIAEAACALAQATHAPGLWYLSGPSGVVNPRSGQLRPIADEALIPGSEALLELSDNIDIIDWSRRTWDFAVLGGIQVDQFGNLNTVAVGDWTAPKVRGPGAIGASVLAGHAGRAPHAAPQRAPVVLAGRGARRHRLRAGRGGRRIHHGGARSSGDDNLARSGGPHRSAAAGRKFVTVSASGQARG
jgi:hypothetical protein